MKESSSLRGIVLIMVALAMVLALVGTVLAAEPTQRPVFWTWDLGGTPIGTSKLVRTGNGLSADFYTEGLTPGNAVTLWFVIFNHPGLCSGGMCGPDDMGVNNPAQGDFLFGGGHVVGDDGVETFGGHLKAGDTSRSGLAERLVQRGVCQEGEACPTPGLTNPQGALVILALHDHGPALTGQALVDQISTFLGDCDTGDIGNAGGFATGPWDLPIPVGGYCSTIIRSPHMPMP
jgi:hypothetical protein